LWFTESHAIGEEQLSSSLRQPSNIGFLVQRIGDGKRVTVGRVPLGHHPEGQLVLRWDLKVDGRKLANGRYLITLRALDAHKHVIDETLPAAITVGSRRLIHPGSSLPPAPRGREGPRARSNRLDFRRLRESNLEMPRGG
jgi:FlgD Ig-like domain